MKLFLIQLRLLVYSPYFRLGIKVFFVSFSILVSLILLVKFAGLKIVTYSTYDNAKKELIQTLDHKNIKIYPYIVDYGSQEMFRDLPPEPQSTNFWEGDALEPSYLIPKHKK